MWTEFVKNVSLEHHLISDEFFTQTFNDKTKEIRKRETE